MADAKGNVTFLFRASYHFVSHLLPLCDYPCCGYHPHSTIPRDSPSSHLPLTLIGSDTQHCDHLDYDRASGWVAVMYSIVHTGGYHVQHCAHWWLSCTALCTLVAVMCSIVHTGGCHVQHCAHWWLSCTAL